MDLKSDMVITNCNNKVIIIIIIIIIIVVVVVVVIPDVYSTFIICT